MIEIHGRLGGEFCEVSGVGVLHSGRNSRVFLADLVKEELCGFDGQGADRAEEFSRVCPGLL